MNDKEILDNLDKGIGRVFDKIEKRTIVCVAIAGQYVAMNKEHQREFDALVKNYKRASKQIEVERSFFSKVKRLKILSSLLKQEPIANVYFDYLKKKGITAQDLDRMDDDADFWRDT